MTRRIDLTETPQVRLARLLQAQDARLGRLETRPTGVKHLGDGGDIVWRAPGWVVNPADPDGPLIPGPTHSTWSVRDVPQVTENLTRDLEQAGDRIAAARQDLDDMQEAVDGVSLDVAGLQGSIGQATQDAADAAQAAAAAQDAAGQAAADAAAALDAAQNAAGKQQIYFGPSAPLVGDPDVLWIDGDGVPHQWVGTPPDTGVWEPITDPRITAAAAAASAAHQEAQDAAAAAQAAAAAADAAQQAADDAGSAAAQALLSASGRNSRIISLDPATGTTHPSTGNDLVDGDTWWQWDNTANRNVIGAWVWRDGQWRSETLTDTVLGSLDVNKLMVLGTARMTEAVVQKIMGDAAYFNAINVEDLTVTGTATIDAAVAAKLAAAMIITRVLRTEVDADTGLYSVMDSTGFHVVDTDGPEGEDLEVTRLGEFMRLGHGDDAIILDNGNVSAPRVSVRELWVGGQHIDFTETAGARGLVAYQQMGPAGHSRRMTGRDIVVSVDCDLAPGRVYKLCVTPVRIDRQSAGDLASFQLHTALDGQTRPWSDWGGTRRLEVNTTDHTASHMEWLIDGTEWTSTRRLVGLLSLANNSSGARWVQAWTGQRPLMIWVEDIGNRWHEEGNPWYIAGGTPPPTKKPYELLATARSMRTYIRGGARDEYSPRTQGQWSSWNRETYVLFDEFSSVLSGADITGVQFMSRFDHWGTGTGNGYWHRHGYSQQNPPPDPGGRVAHGLGITTDWPINADRPWNLASNHWDGLKSGAIRGFAFTTPDTNRSFYGRLAAPLGHHWIRIRYNK